MACRCLALRALCLCRSSAASRDLILASCAFDFSRYLRAPRLRCARALGLLLLRVMICRDLLHQQLIQPRASIQALQCSANISFNFFQILSQSLSVPRAQLPISLPQLIHLQLGHAFLSGVPSASVGLPDAAPGQTPHSAPVAFSSREHLLVA